jgi:3-deoxy-manno-octulosonate cytidylyltransferase (CMP-KDO synthetase)
MIVGLIPTHLKSKRLPKKALLNLGGLPMIIHTYRRAKKAKKLDEVYICTDSSEIIKVCKKFNAKYLKTSSKHKNGTERVAEAAKKIKTCKFIIDIQGDEPLVNPNDIDKVVNFHKKNKFFDIIVPFQPTIQRNNKNIVKIACTKNRVISFSRLDVPYSFDKKKLFLKKHLSIISFKPSALKVFCKKSLGELEKTEGIELMRALELDLKIGTFKAKGTSFSVDILEDYFKASKFLKKDKLFKTYKKYYI